MVTRAEGRGRGLGKSGKKAQTSSCKINKFWGCEVHKDYSSQYYKARVTVAKGAYLTSPHYKEKEKQCNCVRSWMLAPRMVIIISQHIHVSNHSVVRPKLTQYYMSIISQ